MLRRDKPFTMHASLSQQRAALCLCKNEHNIREEQYNFIRLFHLCAFFCRFWRDPESSLFGLQDRVIFPILLGYKRVGLRLYVFVCAGSGNVTTLGNRRSKLHLWASLLYIELTLRGCRRISLPRLLPVGHEKQIIPDSCHHALPTHTG